MTSPQGNYILASEENETCYYGGTTEQCQTDVTVNETCSDEWTAALS